MIDSHHITNSNVYANFDEVSGNYDSATGIYTFSYMTGFGFDSEVEVYIGGFSVFLGLLDVNGPSLPLSLNVIPMSSTCVPGPYLYIEYIYGGMPPFDVNYYDQNGVEFPDWTTLIGDVTVEIIDDLGCSIYDTVYIVPNIQTEVNLFLCSGTDTANFLGINYTEGEYVINSGTTAQGCDSTTLLIVSPYIDEPSIIPYNLGCTLSGLQCDLLYNPQSPIFMNWSVQPDGNGAVVSQNGNQMMGEVGGDYMLIINMNDYCSDTLFYYDSPSANLNVTAFLSTCQDSILIYSVNNAIAPLTYSWSNNVIGTFNNNSGALTNLFANTYTVTVTDSQGCFGIAEVVRSSPGFSTGPPFNCEGLYIGVNINDSETNPYTYEWSGPNFFTSNTLNAQTFENGMHTLVITEPDGCKRGLRFNRNIPKVEFYHCLDALVPIAYNTTENLVWVDIYDENLNQELICAECFETAYPDEDFAYSYQIVKNEVPRCAITELNESDIIQSCPKGVSGFIYLDSNEDCSFNDSVDIVFENKIVRFNNGNNTVLALTNYDGEYYTILEPGTYTVTVLDLIDVIQTSCEDYTITIVEDSSHLLNLGVKTLLECPVLDVAITPGLLRRCLPSFYSIKVCNIGTAIAVDPIASVVMDPLFVSPNAVIDYTLSNDTITFELNDLMPNECQHFNILGQISCEAVLDQVLCTEAFVTPATTCLPDIDSIVLSISSHCDGDSVHFNISNLNGQLNDVEYLIMVDELLFEQQSFNLAPNGQLNITIQAEGSVQWIGVKKLLNDSTNVIASAIAYNCTDTPAEDEIVNQFILNDNLDEYYNTAASCDPVIGSYDPNDKKGVPLGYGDEFKISVDTKLDYKIRFQNTGTDTAFTVVIRDTLPQWLDVASLNLGLSSHYYQASLEENRILVFTFPNIMLPDSFVNEPLSNGFVNFAIDVNPNTPLGTKIENSVGIYFDFNEPVITNLTLHTVSEDFLISAVNNQHDLKPWKVYPNPTSGLVQLRPITNTGASNYTATLYNILGQVVLQQDFTEQGGTIDCSNLKSGSYLLTVFEDGIQVVVRQLVVR